MLIEKINKQYPNKYVYFLLPFVICIVYFPTFSGSFILDENYLIKDNQFIRELHSVYSYFSQEDGIVNKKDQGIYHTGYYRPLINLTYFIDYKIWGINAPGFRITNLILHLLTCLVLYNLFILLLGNSRAAFWSTFLFAIHPINTESVSMIIARNNIVVTLFSLISFYTYVTGWTKQSYKIMILSLVSFAIAIFSKEFGVMLLPIFFFYHRLIAPLRNFKIEILAYIPYIIVLIIYFVLREIVIGSFLTPYALSEILLRIYFVPYILGFNIKLIFLPFGLHQFNLSYPHSVFSWQAIVSLVFIILLGIGLWVYRGKRILLFSLFSFLIAIFPVLSIIPTPSTPSALISMRWLYMPMSFMFIGVAWITQKSFRFRLANPILAIILVYFSIYSILLNTRLWHDEKTFLTQEVMNFGNYLHAGGFAQMLFQEKKLVEADHYFQIAIKHNPKIAQNIINYSSLLIETGNPEKALYLLEKNQSLIMTSHEQAQLMNNKGTALYKLGRKSEALEVLERVVQIAPNEMMFWSNLGSLYGLQGMYEDAVKSFIEGLKISPESLPLKIGLARSYVYLQDYDNALLTLRELPTCELEKNKEARNLLKQIEKSHRK